MKKRVYTVSFIGLLLFVIFLRVYHLSTVPLSMHIDESGLGLNAWSLANYGTDRYGNFMPVCPSNFYGEQSAFYTYFCAALVKIFGLNIYTLRMPGVIMGIVTVVFGSLLIREKWGNKGMLIGMALIGIFPYFIMNSRFALDCNAMLGTLTVALYFLVRLLKRVEKNPREKLYGHFALAGFLFGVILYTYIISAIVVAVFGILFGIYYLLCHRENRGLRFRQLVFLAVPLVIMVIPPVCVVCVNYFDWEPIVTPFFSIPKMVTNRTEEVGLSLSALPQKIRGLLSTLTSDGKYGSSDSYWTMYRWSVPFVVIGGIGSISQALKNRKERRLSIDACMLFLTFAEVIMFLLCGQYNYHINGIFIALAYFCINGILSVLARVKQQRLRIACGAVLACLYSASFAGFAKEYYHDEGAVAYQVYGGVDEALSLLTEEQKKREIYVLGEVGEFYFLSNPVSPDKFAAVCDELGYIRDYGNLHFYEPESYRENHVYVCAKSSGRHQILSDSQITGHEYAVLETDYYYVFYSEE